MPKAAFRDLGAIGWVPDVDGFELPTNAWTDVSNVRFRNGYVEQMPGQLECVVSYTPSTVPVTHWMCHFQTSTTKYIVAAGTTKCIVWDPTQGEFTSIENAGAPLTGTIANKWSGGGFSGYLVVNNGVDKPQTWDANLANDLTALTGWDANWRCKTMRPFKNYLVSLNVTKSGTNYPHMVKWSHPADPGSLPASWDSTNPAYDAGEQDVEGQDIIVDGLQMGETFVIYKERSRIGMQYIGGVSIFRFWRMPGLGGMLAPNCCAVVPQGHIVLDYGDVYIHNGDQPQSILDGRAKKWLITNLDKTNYANSFVCTNPDKYEVWVCIPTNGSTYCDAAIVWNWQTNVLTKRTLPAVTFAVATNTTIVTDPWNRAVAGSDDTWESDIDTWDAYDINQSATQTLVGTAVSGSIGVWYAFDIGCDDGSTGVLQGYAQRYGVQFDDDQNRYMVKSIWPRFSGTGVTSTTMPTISAGGTESPETTPSLTALTASYVPQRFTGVVSGRYFNYKIAGTAGYPWRIKSMNVEAEKLGQF